MFLFIKYFIHEWRNYTQFKWYANKLNPKFLKELEEADKQRGIEPYKNRFDFAYRNAKIRYKHRNYYKE